MTTDYNGSPKIMLSHITIVPGISEDGMNLQ